MRRLAPVLFPLLVLTLVSSACSQDVTGPEPQMADAPEELATTPSFMCNQDEGIWITLEGDDFSPLVFDTIASESDHDLELPTVTLTLSHDPTGAVTDESFSIQLESPPGSDEGAIRWRDGETMEFFVSRELELPEGVYDLEVRNPNGTVVTKTEAFGLLDRPSLHTAIPEMTCLAQGAREVVLEGDNLLVMGSQIPTLRMNGEDLTVLGTANCRDLHAVFTGHQLCEEVTVRLDEASFEAGVYEMTAENFGPAGCSSDPESDGVTVTVNNPPQPQAISPTPICSEQLAVEVMEITGTDFVVVRDDEDNAIYPSVEVGTQSYDAIAADGCEDVESAAALGAERCTQITIAIGADDLADQMSAGATYADLDIRVTNPEPVGCHSTDELHLTTVPPPSVLAVAPDPMCTAQYENTVVISGHGFVSIAGAEPVVHVGEETYQVDSMEDCTDVPTPQAATQSCETLTITVPAGDLDPARTSVVVENPETAACQSTDDATVQVVAPPMVSSVAPQPICTDQEERTLAVDGAGFLDIDGALPMVAIGGEEFLASGVEDCEVLPLDDEDREVQTCNTLLVTVEAGALTVDVHDVVVTNPESAQCASTEEVTVETVPPPMVASISPTPVCSEQVDYETMEIEGTGFVVVRDDNGEERYPTVAIGSRSYDAIDANDCEDFDNTIDLQTQRCTQLIIAIEAGDLAVQVNAMDTHADLNVVVTNPDPIGCSSTDDQSLTVVPPPMVASAAPDPMCTAQFANTVAVSGHGFLAINGNEPVVHVGETTYPVESMSDCTDIDDATISCETVTFAVPQGDIEVGRADIRVENPETAGCQSTEDSTMQVVAPPTVTEISPELVCAATSDQTYRIDGTNFLNVDGALPLVTIGPDTFDATGVDNCETLPVDDPTRTVQQCSTVIVSAIGVDADIHDVVVTNPAGASCESTETLTVETLPPPVIASVDPRALCAGEGLTSFSVTGENFYRVNDVSPVIALDNQIFQTEASNCTVQGDGREVCTTLSLDIDVTQISDDIHQMVAINPDPIGCESEPSESLVIADAPEIEGSDPDVVCEDDSIAGPMTLTGRFVYEPGGDLPEVEINDGVSSQMATVIGLNDCTTTDVGGLTLDTCTELDIEVPESFRDAGFEVLVTAPDPVACGAETYQFMQMPRPRIDAVTPERICVDGGSFHVAGENLREDAEYLLDGIPASSIDFTSEESVTVFFAGPLPEGTSTFEVINPGECGSTYEEEIRVTEGPNPVYVDPPATFDGMTTQVTIYAAGLFGGSIDNVYLIRSDGSFEIIEHTVDPDRPNVVQATIPEGFLEDGETSADFGIGLEDQTGCINGTPGLLTITSELTVAIEAIDPGFGGTEDNTGVEIFAEEDPDDGMVQFVASPRVYLNPSDLADPNADSIAREIQSLLFIDETELNGIITAGLPVGVYDVVVVNPDGAVGVLFDGFEITQESPPVIDAVSPGSWETNDVVTVDVEGSNFREQPTVEVFCRDPGDPGDPLREPASIDVTFVDGDLLELVVDTSNLEQFDACFMRVTNPDGTFTEYSPITVTNPAGNFTNFNPGTSFEIARRGLTTFSGVPSSQARYLYVVGGDDGDEESEVYRSGEFTRLNRFGAPGEWSFLPYSLPTGRTFSKGVRIDDFLYLVGGYDGDTQGVTNEILRARVLDPLDVPDIVGLDLFVEDPEGSDIGGGEDGEDGVLEPGVYYYRVSAVYTDDDPANPGGESLGSEPQPINVPEEVQWIEISWTPPEQINHDIAGYNVYRSVNPDDPYGNEQLLATITDPDVTSFEDNGTHDFTFGAMPLPLGSTGTWHHVSDLQTPRMVAGVAVAPDPTDSNRHYIYTVGGEDDAGLFRADYEFVAVQASGPRVQAVDDNATLGLFSGEPNELLSPRAELHAVAGHSGNANNLSGVPAQIFTLGGRSGAGDADTDVYVTSVTPGGHLDQWTQLPTNQRIQPARYGHGAAVINNHVVIAGGHNGAPDDSVFDSEIICDTNCPPARLETASPSQGNTGMEERVWMGDVPFRGFWYLAGGLDSNLLPTNTVDFTVAGGSP